MHAGGSRQEDESLRVRGEPLGVSRLVALADPIGWFGHDQAFVSLSGDCVVGEGHAGVVAAHTDTDVHC
jgi:hypothetical protein